MNRYKDYFKNHYGASFSRSDVERDRKWFYTQFKFITSLVSIEKNDYVLEIGSGFGGLYSMLSLPNYQGIDLDPAVVEFANKYFETNKFKNISLEEYSSPSKFNYIFAIEVLEHLINPIADIAKIRQLLDNKGMFIGTTPYPFRKNIEADKTHIFVLHPENWKRLFLNGGFSAFKCYPMSFLPFVWRINQYLNLKLPLYLPFPHFISTTLIIAKK